MVEELTISLELGEILDVKDFSGSGRSAVSSLKTMVKETCYDGRI